MFIWKNSVMYSSFEKYMPELFKSITKIYDAVDTEKYNEVLKEEYNKMQSESIDYGIMEKSDNIYVIPGNFGWDDVGSWLAVERLKNVNSDNNIFDGNIVDYDSTNNIVINNSNKKLMALVGVENMVLINTEDAILIMNKDRSQDIKKMLQKLKNNKTEKYL